MSPLVFIVGIWVLLGLLFGGFAVLAMQAEKKRRESLAQLADQMGLEFRSSLGQQDKSDFDKFKLAHKGRNPHVSNVIVADSGELRMVVFDYRYTVGGGKNKSTPKQSVVFARSPSLRLPGFSISPEHFMHRIGDLFGYKDIDFDDDQAFSDRFLLHGDDEQQVREFFDARRRAKFMPQTTVSVEGNHDCFIFFHPRKRWKVEETKQLLEKAFEIYQLLS